MIKVGDSFTGIGGREEVVASMFVKAKIVGTKNGTAYSYEEVYKSWYEQQKQKINSLKTEMLILNNDIVNRDNDDEISVMGQVLLVLENTIIDDWRIEK